MWSLIKITVVLLGFAFSQAQASINLLQMKENAQSLFVQNAYVSLKFVSRNNGAVQTTLPTSPTSFALKGFPTDFFVADNQDPGFRWGVNITNESVKLTVIKMHLARSSSGPSSLRVETLIDGDLFSGSQDVLSNGTNTVTVVYPSTIPAATQTIVINVYAAKASSSNGTLSFDNNALGFALGLEGDIVALPPQPPQVTSITPAKGSSNVTAQSPITIGFSKNISASTGFVTVDCMMQGDDLNYNASALSNVSSIDITLVNSFLSDDFCELTIYHSKITDASSNPLVNNSASSNIYFFTPNVVSPPTVFSSTPQNSEIAFSTTANLNVEFSEPVYTNDWLNSPPPIINFANLFCDGTEIPINSSLQKYSSVGTSLTVNPNLELPNNSSCILSIFSLHDRVSYIDPATTISFTTAMLGDVNLDGLVNLGDAIILERAILGLDTLTSEQEVVADLAPVGGDDTVSLNDLLELKRMLLGI